MWYFELVYMNVHWISNEHFYSVLWQFTFTVWFYSEEKEWLQFHYVETEGFKQ